jgi:hypothetical protein
VIEENGGRIHTAPTPSELGQGQEEEEGEDVSNLLISKKDLFQLTFRCWVNNIRINTQKCI